MSQALAINNGPERAGEMAARMVEDARQSLAEIRGAAASNPLEDGNHSDRSRIRKYGAPAVAAVAALALGVSALGGPNVSSAFGPNLGLGGSPAKSKEKTPKVDLTPAFDNFGHFSDAEIANGSLQPTQTSRSSHIDFIKANPGFAANTAQSAATKGHQAWVYKQTSGQVPNGKTKHDARLEKRLYTSDKVETGTLVAPVKVIDYDANKGGGLSDSQTRVFPKGTKILGFEFVSAATPKSGVEVSVDTDGDGKADDMLIAVRELDKNETTSKNKADYSPFRAIPCKCHVCMSAKPTTTTTISPPTTSTPPATPPAPGTPSHPHPHPGPGTPGGGVPGPGPGVEHPHEHIPGKIDHNTTPAGVPGENGGTPDVAGQGPAGQPAGPDGFLPSETKPAAPAPEPEPAPLPTQPAPTDPGAEVGEPTPAPAEPGIGTEQPAPVTDPNPQG